MFVYKIIGIYNEWMRRGIATGKQIYLLIHSLIFCACDTIKFEKKIQAKNINQSFFLFSAEAVRNWSKYKGSTCINLVSRPKHITNFFR